MNRKRDVSYIKPEDPEFLKVIKKQVGYDDRNHKFDELENDINNFVEDTDNEKPQVVVLRDGDLTAEEAEIEKKKIEKKEEETKADLTQRVVFKSSAIKNKSRLQEGKPNKPYKDKKKSKDDIKTRQLLSFTNEDSDE